MTYDPYIKTGAEIIFYIALGVLIVVLILKKKKQIRRINETTPRSSAKEDRLNH